MKLVIPFLETMATQSCNLSCQGCTNYSDLTHKGYVTWNTANNWLKSWLELIEIPDFGIIGGEPFLNPEINDWLYGCRSLMPNSQLRLTTNGLLIKSVSEILSILDEIENIVFKITVHVKNDHLDETIKEIFLSRPWMPVTEFGINRWKLNNNVRFQINRPENFLMTYRGSYKSMMPHYSVPEKAFELCVQKTCPLLWNGKLYKCSTAGLLGEVLDHVKPDTIEHWTNFIDPGVGPDSNIEDIKKFIDNFGKPNSICAQCPDNKTYLIDHKTTVGTKKQKI